MSRTTGPRSLSGQVVPKVGPARRIHDAAQAESPPLQPIGQHRTSLGDVASVVYPEASGSNVGREQRNGGRPAYSGGRTPPGGPERLVPGRAVREAQSLPVVDRQDRRAARLAADPAGGPLRVRSDVAGHDPRAPEDRPRDELFVHVPAPDSWVPRRRDSLWRWSGRAFPRTRGPKPRGATNSRFEFLLPPRALKGSNGAGGSACRRTCCRRPAHMGRT